MQHAYSRFDNATDIACVGVEAGIAFDKNSAAPITQYTVTLTPTTTLL